MILHLLKPLLPTLLFCTTLFAQQNNIKGEVLAENYYNDTATFTHGYTDAMYYETPVITANTDTKGRFTVSEKFTYPHLYRISWQSEKDTYVLRNSVLFFDATVTSALLDPGNVKTEINGVTAAEFKNKFIPYMLKGGDQQSILIYLQDNSREFDTKLAGYIKQNPNSYVALWFLILRFSESGHTTAFETMTNNFSARMKSEKLWKTLNADISSMRVRENARFPSLPLKNTALKAENMRIPVAKYTLVDFWFSRCKPCLEQMPAWKQLYDTYHKKGFNIIAISTDKTKDIDLWLKRIEERGLNWINYLDENNTEAGKEKMSSYPQNFLLGRDGKIIKRNIEPEELENLLKEQL
jgi:peroxiredoxin